MNRQQQPFVIVNVLEAPAVANATLLPTLANFNRPASKATIYPSLANGAVVIHVNEAYRRVQRNLEAADSVTYRRHATASVGLNHDGANGPLVIDGPIYTLRVSSTTAGGVTVKFE